MRAFLVAWRAILSFYNELFLLAGLSLLWWVTGGLFWGAAIFLAWGMLQAGGPIWLVPLVAIPAAPASAALAHVLRRVARDLHASRAHYWEGWRLYWRPALGLSAASMAILAVLILNWGFYLSRGNTYLRMFSFFWLYLVLYWLSAQLYLFPLLAGLIRPTVWEALRTAAALAFANPLFSLLLMALAALMTGISIVFAILLPLAWPAVMGLVGEHALSLFVTQARGAAGDEGQQDGEPE